MPEIQVNIGGRSFDVACAPGEEAHLQKAAKMLDTETEILTKHIGRLPEARMLLMAGLMLADRTSGLEERAKTAETALEETQAKLHDLRRRRGTGSASAEPVSEGAAMAFADIADEAEALGCIDIAQQMIQMPNGDGLDVILGGGRGQFLPTNQNDPEYPKKSGKRDDGRNLIEEWLAKDPTRQYVWNGDGFAALASKQGKIAGQVMGLFEPSHMQFDTDRAKDPGTEPSIAAMTEFAVSQLEAKAKARGTGYFLLVEAGRIDHAHHISNAYRALEDTVALSDAVQWTIDNVDLEETLIIVTADHSHTMTISGYPRRGNPILGVVETEPGKILPDATGNPYTTLSYANGPGYKKQQPDLTDIDTTDKDYQQLGTVPLMIETHAGEDVAAFAAGKSATQVRGVMEQNKLFNVMHSALFDK